MGIKKIAAEELCYMKNTEALILQGCGGSLEEWVNGVNDALAEVGILLEDTKFHPEDCRTFEKDGMTCLLFPLSEDVKLDMGKLAIWRLQTRESLGGTWLSDYVPNYLGGFVREEAEAKENSQYLEKPNCPLIGQDGNIFHLMGIASQTLKAHGMPDQAEQMCERIRSSGSYNEALLIFEDYVNITSAEEMETSCGMEMDIQL